MKLSMRTIGIVSGIAVQDLDSDGDTLPPDSFPDGYDPYGELEPVTQRYGEAPATLRSGQLPSFDHWPSLEDVCAPSSGNFCRVGF